MMLTGFKVLDITIELWVILLVFGLIALVSLTLYFLIVFKKNQKFVFEKEEVNASDFKRLEKFDRLRNDFEIEIASIKKLQKQGHKK